MKVFICAVFLVVVSVLRDTEAARCDGIPGGTLLMYTPAECNRYYACQHDTDHEWYCPTGEFFNPVNQQCETTCTTGANLWCAGVPDGVFIRVPPTETPNCQKYYTCFGGNMFENFCPPGFLFSQLQQACGFNQAEC